MGTALEPSGQSGRVQPTNIEHLFDLHYALRMPRERTEQQLWRDRNDTKTLVDASWALRRLTDSRRASGLADTIAYVHYAMCGVIDRAALDVASVEQGVRSELLALAAAITHDANKEAFRTRD
jgi:hypothetical protein